MNPAIPFGIIVAAIGLIVSGVSGRSPAEDIRSIIRGQNLPAKAATTAASVTLTGSGSGDLQTRSQALEANPNGLVQLRNYDGKPINMYLAPDAATAFQQAQATIGKNIPLTTAYRTLSSEKQRNAQDSKRYPVPNYHTAGAAIDVWNDTGLPGWLQAPSLDPSVISALTAAGFQRFAPNDPNEQMHWSYGGRG